MRRLTDIRILMALDPSKVALGAVVVDVIEREIVPAIRKMISKTDDSNEQERLEELVDELVEATKGAGAKEWDVIAAAQSRRVSPNDDIAEQIAQDMALKFYDQGFKVGQWYKSFIKRVESGNEGGIKGLKRLWSVAVRDQAKTEIRARTTRKKRDESLDFGDGSGSRSMHEMTPDPVGVTPEFDDVFTKNYINKVKTDMARYVGSRLRRDKAKFLFLMWMKLAVKVGPEKINREEIKNEFIEQTGDSRNYFYELWNEVEEAIFGFFDTLGIRLTNKTKRRIRLKASSRFEAMSSVVETQMALAAWVRGMARCAAAMRA